MSNQRNYTEMVMNLLVPAGISSVATAVTISFFLGGANQNLNSIADTQATQGSQLTQLTAQVTLIDKNQAVMATQITNLNLEIARSNSAWVSLNEDMKCIRMMAAAKGDVNKC
ncbi:MAG: hypothetical protein ACRCTP_03960 [Aeromonas popoffii]|uniref:hypothetical protein n=1 Tax=Aeromonas popoffii TaxID=70856 RepID=UPI003F305744